ncbi:MAG: hypothetical protein Q8L34_02460 [Candidatus Woesearchaeota archaeon]|nr:hypothetical protein [Candidatus Woesearchaeota archaeon]
MQCPKCNYLLKKRKVNIEGARQKVLSFQCSNPDCIYFTFEEESSKKVVAELKAKDMQLKIKQKIVKLSKGRLGTYFNANIVRSIDLKPGEDIYVSVPDKNRIILSREKKRN